MEGKKRVRMLAEVYKRCYIIYPVVDYKLFNKNFKQFEKIKLAILRRMMYDKKVAAETTAQRETKLIFEN